LISRTAYTNQVRNGGGSQVWSTAAHVDFDSSSSHSVESGLWTLEATLSSVSSSDTLNLGTYYISSQEDDLSAPAAEASDAFRTYLPTDTGGKPNKPYLTQQVTCASGPNPPYAGQTERTEMWVTITFGNPTSHPITFYDDGDPEQDTDYVVRAWIPRTDGPPYAADAVHYGGMYAVSHGSARIDSDGSVWWNPGTGTPPTLAAGTTATLSYLIWIQPGSTATFPFTLTGPDGTRAEYYDETGRFTRYGNLCELEADGNEFPRG